MKNICRSKKKKRKLEGKKLELYNVEIKLKCSTHKSCFSRSRTFLSLDTTCKGSRVDMKVVTNTAARNKNFVKSERAS